MQSHEQSITKTKMTYEQIINRIVLTLKPLTLLVEIAGIVLIVWQVFLATNAFQAQTWQGLSQEMNELTKIFVEHPELAPYFEDEKELKENDPLLYAKVIALSDLFLDFIDGFDDNYVYKLDGMKTNGKNRKLWDKYFVDQFKSSPALCQRYSEVKDWYDANGGLSKLASQGCKK